ncbi:MAG: tripartite tricarboxylate transporter permease [Planctomycetes bacterium]|nr:tripartite tricarboxylate transporter permease [Planctomycetota bacterium]
MPTAAIEILGAIEISGMISPAVILASVLGIIIGIMVGALPGLTSTMCMALFVPFTFSIEDPAIAFALLFGLYVGAMHGGAISAILINTPGTPAAAATCFDGYPLAKAGRAEYAINVSTVASTTGGVLSAIALVLIAPQVADLGRHISNNEICLLAIFGLTIIASISGKSLLKGLLAGFIGMFISTIGLPEYRADERRFFFEGFADFRPGPDSSYVPVLGLGGDQWGTPMTGMFIPLMIGVFAFTEVLVQVEHAIKNRGQKIESADKSVHGNFLRELFAGAIRRILMPLDGPTLRRIAKVLGLSSVVGTFIGALPGTGGDIASFVSYDLAKKTSSRPDEFGKGSPEGLAASECANNAVTGGAMMPVVTLGIPGDSVTAVMLQALIIKNFQPGFDFATNPNNELLMVPIFAGLIIANILAYPVRMTLAPMFAKVISVPKHFLWPAVCVFMVVGAYALRETYALDIMILGGVIGYAMRRYGFPQGPLILGLILGPLLEKNLHIVMQLSGFPPDGIVQGAPYWADDFGYPWDHKGVTGFFTRPASIVLWLMIVGTLIFPWIKSRRNGSRGSSRS